MPPKGGGSVVLVLLFFFFSLPNPARPQNRLSPDSLTYFVWDCARLRLGRLTRTHSDPSRIRKPLLISQTLMAPHQFCFLDDISIDLTAEPHQNAIVFPVRARLPV